MLKVQSGIDILVDASNKQHEPRATHTENFNQPKFHLLLIPPKSKGKYNNLKRFDPKQNPSIRSCWNSQLVWKIVNSKGENLS